jgi:hypothetical protein
MDGVVLDDVVLRAGLQVDADTAGPGDLQAPDGDAGDVAVDEQAAAPGPVEVAVLDDDAGPRWWAR